AARRELATIEYASVALVTYVFDRSTMPTLPGGTGVLVPPSEGHLLKAATFTSQKWGWVAEDYPDQVVVRVSVGRFGDASALEGDDEQLAADALGELAASVDVHLKPIDHAVTRWPGALPQYRVGHRELAQRVRRELADAPGIEVCGAAMDGVGIPACIASATAAATRVQEFLAQRGQ
ncbi:MAG TPA: protoporphyrinogen oxidase, partial [Actinomycetes bacterium]|nr:protoporphyrinogen oxidase [Actinomycetes bacterium]